MLTLHSLPVQYLQTNPPSEEPGTELWRIPYDNLRLCTWWGTCRIVHAKLDSEDTLNQGSIFPLLHEVLDLQGYKDALPNENCSLYI